MDAFLPDGFWREFLATRWQKDLLAPTMLCAPIMTAESAFEALLAASRAFRRPDPRMLDTVRWTSGPGAVQTLSPQFAADTETRLPLPEDRSFEDFAERHARVSSTRRFFLTVGHFQRHTPTLWNNVRAFWKPVFDHSGVPQRSHCALYVGNYDATPFGVHIDAGDNFTIGIVGKKTYFVWEPDVYLAHEASFKAGRWRDLVGLGTKLTIAPGQIMYWPRRLYHIAAPDGELTVSASLASYENKSTVDLGCGRDGASA